MPFAVDRNNMDAFLEGAVLYGTGGGGEAAWGRSIMENDFARGRTYRFISPEDVPDDSFICSGGIMGSVASLGAISYEEVVDGWEAFFPLVEAIRTMERLCNRKVDYLIPFEIGALNSPVIFSAAARLGIPCIDGDAVGRAAPETQMSSFIGNGVDLYPMPVVDRNGNASVVLSADSPTYADEIGRLIVVKGGGMAANAHYSMSGAQMKQACVPGMMSKALEAGEAILAASNGDETAAAVRRIESEARMLFTGTIANIEGADRGGFYLTDVMLQGTGEAEGKTAKLVIKNETMAIWIEGELRCMFPDLILMVDSRTGKPIPTIELKKNRELILIGVPCPPAVFASLQSEKGTVAFGPARYGYDQLTYTPFRQLLSI